MAEQGKNQGTEEVYLPTKAEQRLLAVLTNPKSRLMLVQDIQKAAKISEETYYKALKKPGFRKLCDEITREVLRSANIQVAHALAREAVRGSAPHIKMHLEIAEILKPGKDSGERIADAFERWLDGVQSEKGS